MEFGAAMFFTDHSMAPGELAQALEARGFESVWAPEHSHIPTSRETPFPQGGELPIKNGGRGRARPFGGPGDSLGRSGGPGETAAPSRTRDRTCPSQLEIGPAGEILPVLDRWAELISCTQQR